MKKLMISIAACFGISSVAMTSCQEQLPQTVQEQWEEKQDEVVSAVSAEMQKALKAQLNDFIQNDDLGESLGFSEEQISQWLDGKKTLIWDFAMRFLHRNMHWNICRNMPPIER